MARKNAAEEAPTGPVRVVVVKGFTGAPDGAVYPRDFAPGDVIDGDLAAVALREGWAKPG